MNLNRKPSKAGQMRLLCGSDIDRATCCVDQSPQQLRRSADK
jgi:hypothetical protein